MVVVMVVVAVAHLLPWHLGYVLVFVYYSVALEAWRVLSRRSWRELDWVCETIGQAMAGVLHST